MPIPGKQLSALVDKHQRDGKKMPPKFVKGGHGGGDDDQDGDDGQKHGDQKKGPSDEQIAAQQGARVKGGDVDEEVMSHVSGYDPEQDGNPPEFVEDEATWERAHKAVEPRFGDYDEPWAVIAHVYKAMGGKFKGGDDAGGDDAGGGKDDAGAKDEGAAGGGKGDEE